MVSRSWFMKFSPTKPVKIVPYNPKILVIVNEFTKLLRKTIGNNVTIEHRGATALGISGVGEVDLYIMVSPKKWKKILSKLEKKFGKPGSLDHEWARFNQVYKNIEFEIMLVHENCKDNIENQIFFNHLKSNKKDLERYEQLKVKYSRVSEREYYLQKDKFIKRILKLENR